jgi:hypothetical protein
VNFIMPQLNPTSVVNLLANAGVLIGVGDFRQEKGKGNFGSFRVVGPGVDDAEWDDLVAHHGREAQQFAFDNPVFADKDTEDLMEFFHEEFNRRAA